MNDKTMFTEPTSIFEIYKCIMQLKDKFGGVDGIGAKAPKLMAPCIPSSLHYLFNL